MRERGWALIAEGIVWFSGFKIVWTLLMALLAGTLSDAAALFAGAAIMATITFVEFFFAEVESNHGAHA
jgi:hypothetical protein